MVAKNPYIKSIAYYLPEKILTNQDLEQVYKEWSSDKIYNKIGIKQRHIASDNEHISDMAEKACNKLFEENDIKPEEIDFILLCTQTPDYLLPTTACILQHRLNIPVTCGALDFNLGCSGFVYGLGLAKSLIISGIAKNILLVTSEAYSKHINDLDKSTRTVFGDAATAVLVSSDENKVGIEQFVFGTDGSGAENLIIPSGGTRMPRTTETAKDQVDEAGNTRSQDNLYMNGPEIFNFTIKAVPKLVNDLLDCNGYSGDQIDYFVFHQANKYMLDYLRRKIKIPEDKFYINMADTGNTVSNTIPIALKNAEKEGKIKKGDKIMIAGFGVGYSWGGTIINW